jgi:hypothetical protein
MTNGVITMNNKKNLSKLFINQKSLCTYLYVNKNQFLPNGKKSYNLYFDHERIADGLGWSSKKVYRIVNECIKSGLITIASNKYYAGKYSRLIHLELLAFGKYFQNQNISGSSLPSLPNNIVIFDQKVIEEESKRFMETTFKNKNQVSPPFPNNVVIFETVNYGKTTKKYINYIHPNIAHYLLVNDKIEFINPKQKQLVDKINSTNKTPCEYIAFNEKITIGKTVKRYSINKSCRATSKYCASESGQLRPVINKILNLVNNYDIPSCVPNMFILLNTGKTNLDVDLKQKIIGGAKLDGIINKDDLKKLWFRIIFSKSYNHSVAKMKYAVRQPPITDKQLNNINLLQTVLPYWKSLYDTTHNLIGDTSMLSKIFYYESILELRTVLALREQNYYTSNIYDCFYSEATPDIIKTELKKQMSVLYGDYVNGRL